MQPAARNSKGPGSEEEGECEYASYHERALEREASFGPGMAIMVSNKGEGHGTLACSYYVTA